MTSEAYVLGTPIAARPIVGARIRQFAEGLGPGHVDAAVQRRRDGRFRVLDARAYPLTARDFDIGEQLDAYLNE